MKYTDIAFIIIYTIASIFTIGSIFFPSSIKLALIRGIIGIGTGLMWIILFKNGSTIFAYAWSFILILLNLGFMFGDYVVYNIKNNENKK